MSGKQVRGPEVPTTGIAPATEKARTKAERDALINFLLMAIGLILGLFLRTNLGIWLNLALLAISMLAGYRLFSGHGKTA